MLRIKNRPHVSNEKRACVEEIPPWGHVTIDERAQKKIVTSEKAKAGHSGSPLPRLRREYGSEVRFNGRRK